VVAPAAVAPITSPRVITGADIRALLEDPAIRNAVGLAENSWDFTAPNGVPGFGPIRAVTTHGTTTLACAERDVQLITSLEDHGNANDIPSEKLGEAGLSLQRARTLCGDGRQSEALALYDNTLRSLSPMHAAR
jgi:hypothetical protein